MHKQAGVCKAMVVRFCAHTTALVSYGRTAVLSDSSAHHILLLTLIYSTISNNLLTNIPGLPTQ